MVQSCKWDFLKEKTRLLVEWNQQLYIAILFLLQKIFNFDIHVQHACSNAFVQVAFHSKNRNGKQIFVTFPHDSTAWDICCDEVRFFWLVCQGIILHLEYWCVANVTLKHCWLGLYNHTRTASSTFTLFSGFPEFAVCGHQRLLVWARHDSFKFLSWGRIDTVYFVGEKSYVCPPTRASRSTHRWFWFVICLQFSPHPRNEYRQEQVYQFCGQECFLELN